LRRNERSQTNGRLFGQGRKSCDTALWLKNEGIVVVPRIENGLHWFLDIAFGEGQARMREGNSAENFSILRRITLNLLRQDKSTKAGIKNRRLLAGWDATYLEKVLKIQAIA
jgi:hypothetical protein